MSMYLPPGTERGMMTSGKLASCPHGLQSLSRWTFMVNGSWNRVFSFTSRCVVRNLSTLIQQGIERGSSQVCLLSVGRLAAPIPNH